MDEMLNALLSQPQETAQAEQGIGQEILFAARNELYMHMPYLDEALCALRFEAGKTLTIATDGKCLYYAEGYLKERYLRSSVFVNRVYLHAVLHCLFRHLWKRKGRDPVLWDLACDAVAESVIESLPYACLHVPANSVKEVFLGECEAELPVLTAELIYRKLLRDRRPEYEIAKLTRAFLADDHSLWEDEPEDGEQQDEKWQNIASKAQTGMQTVMSEESHGGEAVLEQVQIAAKAEVDYRKFLRRFAAPREVMKCDDDAFDYSYYSYGLRHYGNMPLIEPPETKEERRIEDFVIAIDTSMSTSGELVREFLRCTYTILRSTESFTQRLNIHIMQCDDTLRSDTKIESMAQLAKYMDSVSLCGGSATDFRPVFQRVEELKKSGEFTSLRGLIYFTDGMGIYPAKRPDYEAAFVFLAEPPLSVKIPAWCVRVVLDGDSFGTRAPREKTEYDDALQEEALAELPQL